MKKIVFALYFIMNTIPLSVMAMMPQLSPAEMQQLEQLERQLMQEIDQYVASLPPEEQRKFHEAVEEETRKIEQMQPEELNKYIEEAFSEMDSSLKDAAATPQKTAPIQEKEEAKPIKPEETEKQVKAIEVIDNAIKNLENYLLKLNSFPESAKKLPYWASQGRIVSWKPDATFNSFKKEVETFSQQLHKIRKKDEKTSKYIFLPDIIANEALINNIGKINNTLSHWIPQIKLKTHDFETISTESKNAFIQATNVVLEGLTILAVPQALDDIIVKYDPVAKQQRDEEEKTRKRALEESKRGQKPGVTRSIGSDKPDRSPRNYSSDYYDGGGSSYSPYRGSSYPTNYGRSYGQEYPSYGSQRSKQPYSQAQKGRSAASGASFGGGTYPTKGMSDTQKMTEQPNKDGSTQTASVAPQEISEQAKRRINAITDSIERALDRLEKAKLTKPLTILTQPQDLNLATIELELNYADRAIQYLEDASSTLQRLASSASAEQKKIYAKRLLKSLEEHKRTITTMLDEIKKIKENETSFSDEKRYAYLGGKATVPDETKAAITKPFNLYKIAQLLNEIQQNISALNAGKSITPVK